MTRNGHSNPTVAIHCAFYSVRSHGEVCSIGSANLDIRGFSINYELNAVIYDTRLSCELEAAFERDLKDCYPFDADGYQHRPVLKRLRDSTARLLSPLL